MPKSDGRKPCDQCGEVHADAMSRWAESLYLTASTLCGFNLKHYRMEPSPILHQGITLWLQNKLQAGHRRIAILAPRDHLKTSILDIAFCVWLFIQDPTTRIFQFHKNAENATGLVAAVQDIAMSKDFRHYFGPIVPDLRKVPPNGKRTRWNETEMELARPRYHPQASLTAVGLDSTVEGGHVHCVLFDDPVDRKTARSRPLMVRAVEALDNVDPLLESAEKGLVLAIGTLWPGGFWEKILADTTWVKLVLGCYQDARSHEIGLTNDGEPIWPEEHTKKSLAAIHRRMGNYYFSHQYLNVPMSLGAAKFEEKDLRYFSMDRAHGLLVWTDEAGKEQQAPWSRMKLTATADPSRGGDDFAITVVAYDPVSVNIFVLDLFAEPVGGRVGLEKLVYFCQRWGLRTAGVEGFDDLLQDWYRVMQITKGYRIRIENLEHGGRSKTDRIIEGLQPFVEGNRFFVQRKHDRIAEEMRNWNPESTTAQRDNILDSLAYHRDLWNIRRVPKDKGKGKDADIPRDRVDRRPRKPYSSRRTEEAPAYGLRRERERYG